MNDKIQLPDAFWLPFSDIKDLIEKVESLRVAHLEETRQLSGLLISEGIEFDIIDDYFVGVNMEELTKEQRAFVKQDRSSPAQKLYNDLGILKFQVSEN